MIDTSGSSSNAAPSSTARRFFYSLLIATLVAAANIAIWAWAYQPSHPPAWHGQINGFAFSAFQRNQSPIDFTYPTEAEIEGDIALMARYSPRFRTYSSYESDAFPRIAAKYGIEVTAGAWLDRRADNNARELTALIEAAKKFPNIPRVIVGNETLLRGDLSVRQIIPYLDKARAAVRVPVSTAEPWHIWLKYPELVKHVDYITVHLLPYWEGVPERAAVATVLERYERVRKAYPNKHILIGEVGWPSDGDRYRNAIASTANAARFTRHFLNTADERGLDYFVMEAFDQPWKEAGEGRTGAYWGMFDASREPKFPLDGPVDEDPDWIGKAWLASVLAWFPMLWFVWTFSRFATWGRFFYAGLIQASVGLLVWSISLPYTFYLEPLEWLMLILLMPAQFAIVGILLINGFEFTEALSQPDWQRRFRPLDHLPDPAPKVSIHVPCHNEPPEMVIQTLDSLAALDYPDFEVLVIDNNTKNAAIWQPVEAYCRQLGARFRFFHLDPWPGFKAGALNFALEQTDPAAKVIAVIDSDYVVRTDWLRALVGHFGTPEVGIVQAPQAHREYDKSAFRRMCNWEYEGFFRIGMHHRNERDAIIQHGTMTMIRRSVMDKLRWSEWCICEDAELGLRVMEEGFTTVYVDEVFGRGVTPADFAAFKSQRFRWAFGAMQILRRHWGELVHGAGALTRGQRYHFLTGWFSWFADALHLAFSLLAVVWSIGMLAAPAWFAVPHELFLLPVLGFFVAKAAFGLVLYRARVPCSWRDALGASIASMALSHAIARGVFRGLVATEHPFTRTAKKRRLNRQPSRFVAVREEAGLFALLMLSVIAVISIPGSSEIEVRLWMVILAAQSIPYLSSLICAYVAAHDDSV